MVILALDTTTKAGSCALWRDGALVEQRPGDASRTHAERLPGDLADLLAAHGLTVKDVDLYAVASGPGSFTGLRVGIATIQGLALVHNRKVVAVSALEALALCGATLAGGAAAPGGTTIAGGWMEAYRGEVFGALYRVSAGALEELAPPSVAAPAELAASWARIIQGDRDGDGGSGNRGSSSGGEAVIIGDAVPSTREALSAALPASVRLLDTVPLASTIAQIAHAHPESATLPHAIVPLYVRRPDAELARDRRDRGDARPVVPA